MGRLTFAGGGLLDFKVLLLEKPGGAPKASFSENKGPRAGRPNRPLCSRNARLQKDGTGAARPSFLLAEPRDKKDWKDTHVGPVLPERAPCAGLLVRRAQ
jgi:hypothetical protein